MFSRDKNIKDSVLLFGGSFDPPHLGHKAMLEHVLQSLSLSKIIIAPCYIQPLKGRSVSSAEHRLNMSGLQFTEKKFNGPNLEFIVSDYEIKKADISYTVDAIKHLKKIYPDGNIYILMGEDSFLDIEKWKVPKELLSFCSVIVVARKKFKVGEKQLVSKLVPYVEKIKKEYSADISIIDNFDHPASSTILREELSKGQTPKYIDDDVLEYINKNKLYKVQDVQ